MPSERRLNVNEREFIRSGLPRRPWQDLYHSLMTVRWSSLFASFAGFYVIFNLLFAAVYSLQPGDIANLNPPNYWGRFFFSVETLATVGYGDMHPQTVFAHTIASVEIFVGLMSVAVITGMMFARFSRPTARFLFARHVVIRPLDGRLTLVLRTANARQNVVMEASAQLRLLRDEQTLEGYRIRRIYDLPLRRHQHPVFLFGWMLMHDIDASSPLADVSPEALKGQDAYLLLTLTGRDETTGQTLMARHAYPISTWLWNHSFVDIFSLGPDGIDRFDYSKFHEVEPLA